MPTLTGGKWPSLIRMLQILLTDTDDIVEIDANTDVTVGIDANTDVTVGIGANTDVTVGIDALNTDVTVYIDAASDVITLAVPMCLQARLTSCKELFPHKFTFTLPGGP